MPLPDTASLSDEPETWGHMMDPIDTSKTFQILLQNLNGMNPDHMNLEMQFSLSKCYSLGIGVILVAESKLNWTGAATYNMLRWFCQSWQFSTVSSSQVDEKFSSTFQLGGTLTAVVDWWTSRVYTKGQDPFGLGRWSYVTLRGKNSTMLTIIRAYRVCQKASSSTGVKATYIQQVRALKAINLSNDNSMPSAEPNKQFILDLQAWIQYIQAQGHLIILNMDNNEDLYMHDECSVHPLSYQPETPTKDSSHNGSLRTLAITCGLIDILAIQHSAHPFPALYIRGRKRIDYMLAGYSGALWDSSLSSCFLLRSLTLLPWPECRSPIFWVHPAVSSTMSAESSIIGP